MTDLLKIEARVPLRGKRSSFFVQSLVFAYPGNNPFRIPPVQNAKRCGQMNPVTVQTEHTVGERMKGPPFHTQAMLVQKLGAAGKHFLRGPAGECQKKNCPGLHALLHQPGHPVNQRAGFAAPGPGYDQNRTGHVRDRLQLRWVEFLFVLNYHRAPSCVSLWSRYGNDAILCSVQSWIFLV